ADAERRGKWRTAHQRRDAAQLPVVCDDSERLGLVSLTQPRKVVDVVDYKILVPVEPKRSVTPIMSIEVRIRCGGAQSLGEGVRQTELQPAADTAVGRYLERVVVGAHLWLAQRDVAEAPIGTEEIVEQHASRLGGILGGRVEVREHRDRI